MTGHIDSVLGAASLLTAVVALLYSLWYPEIRQAIDVVREPKKPDRGPAIRLVRGTFTTKSVPLLLVTALQLLVFGPDAVAVAVNALRLTTSGPPGKTIAYDSVQAAFLAVYVLSAVLAVVAAGVAIQLRRKLAKLEAT